MQLYLRLRFASQAGPLRSYLACMLSPGLLVLAVHRVSHRWRELRVSRDQRLLRVWLRTLIAFGQPLVVVRAKAEVISDTDIAPGVFFSDRGHLILGARAIGDGTVIHHAVTIGMNLMTHGKPMIGRNVWIGPDCVVHGNIEIGDGATLLPGTVLTKSIPANTLVSGNPARVLRRDFDNTHLRGNLNYDIGLDDEP